MHFHKHLDHVSENCTYITPSTRLNNVVLNTFNSLKFWMQYCVTMFVITTFDFLKGRVINLFFSSIQKLLRIV